MAATGLKAPPRFVKSEWAWAHTLEKLRIKGQLDEDGNPTNYAAANRIYQNVVAKYGPDMPDMPDALSEADRRVLPPELNRAKVMALDIGAWVVSRGLLWAASDERMQRMWFQRETREGRTPASPPNEVLEPLYFWRIEVLREGAKETCRLPDELALWLVRESRAGTFFVREQTQAAIDDLRDLQAGIQSVYDQVIAGEEVRATTVGEHAIPAIEYFDFGTTLSNLSRQIGEMERSLAA